MEKYIFSKQNSIQLKGIACLMIVLHHFLHLTGGTNNIITYIIGSHFGYIFVSLFFLLSAYGLTESELNKKSNFYTFLKKRLLRVYIPFIYINIFTLFIYELIQYKSFSFFDVILHIIGIKLIDPFLWYILVSLLLYVLFWISFQVKSNANKLFILLSLVIIYMLFAHFYFNFYSNSYFSVLSFPLGMFCSLYKNEIAVILEKKLYFLYYSIYGFSILILFFIFHKLGWQIIKTICMSFIFVPLYLIISYKNELNLPLLNFIGNISYEIYLVHMKVFILIGLYIPLYKNLIVFLFIVILIAYLFNQIFNFINIFTTRRINLNRLFIRN